MCERASRRPNRSVPRTPERSPRSSCCWCWLAASPASASYAECEVGASPGVGRAAPALRSSDCSGSRPWPPSGCHSSFWPRCSSLWPVRYAGLDRFRANGLSYRSSGAGGYRRQRMVSVVAPVAPRRLHPAGCTPPLAAVRPPVPGPSVGASFLQLVPGAGFEPARPFGQWILSPPRLPFRHPGQSGRSLIPATPPPVRSTVTPGCRPARRGP